MKKFIIPLAASLAVFSTAALAAPLHYKARSTEGNPTSTRTPGKQVTTPENQVDTTKSGQTSDRTPSNHGENGAASGEKGAGMSGSKVSAQQEQAYEDTYKTDKAQEKLLKSGGGSK